MTRYLVGYVALFAEHRNLIPYLAEKKISAGTHKIVICSHPDFLKMASVTFLYVYLSPSEDRSTALKHSTLSYIISLSSEGLRTK